jgi:hypothetical protein
VAKGAEIAETTILSPLRLPFRHIGAGRSEKLKVL